MAELIGSGRPRPGAAGAGTVIVLGGINIDVTAYLERRPLPGETVHGLSSALGPGGKGANQAMMCARYGAATTMVAMVGEDGFGDLARAELSAAGVDLGPVRRAAGAGTGLAHIRVDRSGQNDIVVVPNANALIGPQDVDRGLAGTGRGDFLLTQLEIPVPTVEYAIRTAHARGLRVILDPAPALELDPRVWAAVDITTPNEAEAERCTGIRVADLASAVVAARWFLARGVRQVCLTRGAEPLVLAGPDGVAQLAPPKVDAVDTTAAGDAFSGALAGALAAGQDLAGAVRLAVAAGALTVTRRGAAGSLPSRAEIDALLPSVPAPAWLPGVPVADRPG